MGTSFARVVAFLLAAAAVAAGPSVGAQPKQIPFHAVFQFTPSVASDPGACSQLRIDVAGTGIGTHLGRFTTVQHHCTTFADPLAFTDGEYRFTAANGDQIYGTYSGRFVPIDAEHLALDGAWTIEGGTGRFAGATGGGPASGSGTAAGGTVILDGTITSVGSRKHD